MVTSPQTIWFAESDLQHLCCNAELQINHSVKNFSAINPICLPYTVHCNKNTCSYAHGWPFHFICSSACYADIQINNSVKKLLCNQSRVHVLQKMWEKSMTKSVGSHIVLLQIDTLNTLSVNRTKTQRKTKVAQ